MTVSARGHVLDGSAMRPVYGVETVLQFRPSVRMCGLRCLTYLHTDGVFTTGVYTNQIILSLHRSKRYQALIILFGAQKKVEIFPLYFSFYHNSCKNARIYLHIGGPIIINPYSTVHNLTHRSSTYENRSVYFANC